MRFLAAKQPLKANIFGQDFRLMNLDPGIENLEDILVTDDFSASELFSRHQGLLLEVKFDIHNINGFPRIVNKLSDIKSGGRILIIRNGGIGDHIMFLPILGVFREMLLEKSEIWLSTQKEKHSIFSNNRNINKLYSMPLRLDTVLEADYLIDFSGRIDSYEFTHLNMTDYFLNLLEIDYNKVKNKTPKIKWDRRKSHKIFESFNTVRKANANKPTVLLNWKASNRLRDLPPDKLLSLAENFENVLFVVAQPKKAAEDTARLLKGYGSHVLDFSPYMDSLEDYITITANCDAIVSTDTGTSHLAEALGKPSLTIYGPIDGNLRIFYYNKAFAITAEYLGETCQSPCGLSKCDGGCREAILMGTSYSPCLLSIPNEIIHQHFKKFCDKILKISGYRF